MTTNISELQESGRMSAEVNGAKKVVMGMLMLLFGAAVLVALVGAWCMPSSNPRTRAEREHGIRLPASAAKIQCRGDAWHGFLDRNAYTIFEMERGELAGFVGCLSVEKRELPPGRSLADPIAVNVLGENDYFKSDAGRFEQTWPGNLVPVEKLSCASPISADWLHVEFWELPGTKLFVKIHSNWN